MYSPDHYSPPPVYADAPSEFRQRKAGFSLSEAVRQVLENTDRTNHKQPPPPVAPSTTFSPPAALVSKQVAIEPPTPLFWGGVQYESKSAARPRAAMFLGGQQDVTPKNITGISNIQLRAEALHLLEQMRGCLLVREGNSQTTQTMTHCEARLGEIASYSPVLRGFIERRRRTFLESVKRGADPRTQTLKNRQRELHGLLRSHELRGKQCVLAMGELRRIETELGQGETGARS